MDLLVSLVDFCVLICRFDVPVTLEHMVGFVVIRTVGFEVAFVLDQLIPEGQILGMIGKIVLHLLFLLV